MKIAVKWVTDFSYITDTAISVIMTARKTFLYDEVDFWAKEANYNFDVSIGAFDGAEVCELEGLYVLYMLVVIEELFAVHEIGLFRDDGLSVVGAVSMT